MLTITLSSAGYHHVNQEWVSFRKGEEFARSGEVMQAIVQYQQAIAAGLQIPEVFFSLTEAYLTINQPTKAVELLEQNPNPLPLQLKMAEILSGQESYDTAESIYRAILIKHPNHRTARLALARVLTWRGRFETAILEYKKVLEE